LRNYPNPFNNATAIIFSLQEPQNIKLEIYNISGEKIAVLLDEHKPAGYYSVRWEADNIPSGIYLCRLKTDFHDSMAKMLLLK
jgi:hypothetical protein